MLQLQNRQHRPNNMHEGKGNKKEHHHCIAGDNTKGHPKNVTNSSCCLAKQQHRGRLALDVATMAVLTVGVLMMVSTAVSSSSSSRIFSVMEGGRRYLLETNTTTASSSSSSSSNSDSGKIELVYEVPAPERFNRTSFTLDDFVINGVNLATYGMEHNKTAQNKDQQSSPAVAVLAGGSPPKFETAKVFLDKPFVLYDSFNIGPMLEGGESYDEMMDHHGISLKRRELIFYNDKIAYKRFMEAVKIPCAKSHVLKYKHELLLPSTSIASAASATAAVGITKSMQGTAIPRRKLEEAEVKKDSDEDEGKDTQEEAGNSGDLRKKDTQEFKKVNDGNAKLADDKIRRKEYNETIRRKKRKERATKRLMYKELAVLEKLMPRKTNFVAKPTHTSCSTGVWMVQYDQEKDKSNIGYKRAKAFDTDVGNTESAQIRAISAQLVSNLYVKAPTDSWSNLKVKPGIMVEDRFTAFDTDDKPALEFKVFVIWGKVWLAHWKRGGIFAGLVYRNGMVVDWKRKNKEYSTLPEWMDWNRVVEVAERIARHKDIFRIDMFVGLPAGHPMLSKTSGATEEEKRNAIQYVINEVDHRPKSFFQSEIMDEANRLWMAGYKMNIHKVVPNTEVPRAFMEKEYLTEEDAKQLELPAGEWWNRKD